MVYIGKPSTWTQDLLDPYKKQHDLVFVTQLLKCTSLDVERTLERKLNDDVGCAGI